MVLLENKTQENGSWKYPIASDEPKGVLQGSGIAVTATGDVKANIYYQIGDGTVVEKLYNGGKWTERAGELALKPKLHSPLAAVNYQSGDEVRVYCISDRGLLEEWCHSSDRKDWYSGLLSERLFRPSLNSKLAALRWDTTKTIRVFGQEYFGSDWKDGQKLPVEALPGTSLAVTCYEVANENRVRVSLYYQAYDRTVKEICMDNFDGNWFEGGLKTDRMMTLTSIATIKSRVYCQDENHNIVGYKNEPGHTDWTSDGQVVAATPIGGFFSALQFRDGMEKKFYYQGVDNKIYERIQMIDYPWYNGTVVTP